MEKSQATPLIQKELERYKQLFCLEAWDIRVYFSRLKENTPAEVELFAAYKQAHITFDLGQTENDYELVRNLRHEMLHITTANFDHVVDVAKTGLSEHQTSMLVEVYDYHSEQVVNLFENILSRLDIPLETPAEHKR